MIRRAETSGADRYDWVIRARPDATWQVGEVGDRRVDRSGDVDLHLPPCLRTNVCVMFMMFMLGHTVKVQMLLVKFSLLFASSSQCFALQSLLQSFSSWLCQLWP